MNLDDLRAIAVVAAHRRVSAVVATDGILSAERGAATLARFLAGADPERPAIIRGFGRFTSTPQPPVWDWWAQTRSEAERLESELAQTAPPLQILTPTSAPDLGELVAHAVRDCPTLGLLVTGPWSSFVAYHSRIADRIRFVVSQGQPPDDPVDPGWDGVNCSLDVASCRAALDELRDLGISWINLARDAPFPLDEAMINGLGARPLRGHSTARHDRKSVVAKAAAMGRCRGHFRPASRCVQASGCTLRARYQLRGDAQSRS